MRRYHLVLTPDDAEQLADFTGSDWCGWCIKLDEEVFAHAEFLDYGDAQDYRTRLRRYRESLREEDG